MWGFVKKSVMQIPKPMEAPNASSVMDGARKKNLRC